MFIFVPDTVRCQPRWWDVGVGGGGGGGAKSDCLSVCISVLLVLSFCFSPALSQSQRSSYKQTNYNCRVFARSSPARRHFVSECNLRFITRSWYFISGHSNSALPFVHAANTTLTFLYPSRNNFCKRAMIIVLST